MIRKTVVALIGILACCSLLNCSHGVVIPLDISPDFANGTVVQGNNAPTGVISEMAGSEAALYAIGLNSGVWKSTQGGKWHQLPNAPRYASIIDVSPVNDAHIVTGEHDGETDDPLCSRNGIWESFDSGDSWQLTWMSNSTDSDKRNVKALTFTPLGTVLFAAGDSLYRRTVLPSNPDYCLRPPRCFENIPLPAGVTEVIALCTSRAKIESTTWIVWALARSSVANEPGKILWSLDDGQTWNAAAIPHTMGTLVPTLYNFTTIAGYGMTAVWPCKVSDATSQTIMDHLPYCCGYNTCMLLYYSIETEEFHSQVLMLKPKDNSDEAKRATTFGDGTGLGGCQRIRAFTSGSSWGDEQVGQKTRIFYNVGQEVLSAKGVKRPGILDWELLALSPASGREESKDPIHCDIWDTHYDPETQSVRLATDGGVFKSQVEPLSSGALEVSDEKWVMHNSGLHTQHVHNLVVLDDQVRKVPTSNIAYTTHDNDAWYRDNAGSAWSDEWKSVGMFGDADCVDGDPAISGVALLWRVGSVMCYTDFGKGKPEEGTGNTPDPLRAFIPFYSGKAVGTGDTYCDSYVFPRSFKVVQTLKDESPQPLLDVVALMKYPLYSFSTTVNKVVLNPHNSTLVNAATLPADSMMLLRNTAFLAKPDANGPTPYAHWKHAVPNVTLPTGTNSVWVSNGHHETVFYLLANGGGANTVWKIEKVNGQYTLIQLNGIGAQVMDLPGGYGKVGFGPLYVDPYDPDHVFVFTSDGIRVSPAGQTVGQNTQFELDTVLTKLITESGTYSQGNCYWGGPVSDAYKHAMGTSTFVISGVAFSKEHPHHVVVASPVAGLFVSTAAQHRWLSLNEYLPRPLTQIAGVAMDGDNAYAALEGRGLWKFIHYENAKPASFFDVKPRVLGSRKIYLRNADSKYIGDAQVSVTLVIGGEEKEISYETDANGLLTLPQDYFKKVLHLKYEGDDQSAACTVSISPNR